MTLTWSSYHIAPSGNFAPKCDVKESNIVTFPLCDDVHVLFLRHGNYLLLPYLSIGYCLVNELCAGRVPCSSVIDVATDNSIILYARQLLLRSLI